MFEIMALATKARTSRPSEEANKVNILEALC